MRVLITGATGLIGQEIITHCHSKDIGVHFLTTRKSKLTKSDREQGFLWDPNNDTIDPACFEGVDAIINLVGASIAKTWTAAYKKEIINSRTKTASLILNSLKSIPDHTVKQLISASAVGIYQDSETILHAEDSTAIDNSFLAEVVKQWEESVDAFSEIGVRVTKIRIGLVLAKNDGVLAKMATPIKYGVGAAFGSGSQWQSWIHIDDLAALFLYVLSKNTEGVINGVAPNPVTNLKLTKEIATVLKKPLILPKIPKLAMKLALGEMHELLFASQRVSSKKAENMGFNFKYANINQALTHLLS